MSQKGVLNLFPRDDAPNDKQKSWMDRRPPARPDQWNEAEYYVADPDLETALDLALSLGDPLLITGEAGTGKTQAAFFAARRLGLAEPIHFQVRSTTVAKDLKYTFDTIAYFRAAHVFREAGGGETPPDKKSFLVPGALWEALTAKEPRVLLIDEIDKAPRDFPNDLLHELDQLNFRVPELDDVTGGAVQKFKIERPADRLRPLVVITSNSEHRLPEAFLRRCVYHHITLGHIRLEEIVRKRPDLGKLSKEVVTLAIERYLELRRLGLRKPPSTHELLMWLKALAMWSGTDEAVLKAPPAQLPFRGLLVKCQEDLDATGG